LTEQLYVFVLICFTLSMELGKGFWHFLCENTTKIHGYHLKSLHGPEKDIVQ